MAVTVVVLGGIALATPVINHDTHAYRLPRIGMWLLHNHIGHFETPKLLMNFSGRTAESLMLWLVTFFKHGFPLIHTIQWFSGVVTLAATHELARRIGLPRWARWAALVVLLGMPNVLVQFTTSQTDLTATGLTTAGLVFVHEALRTRRLSAFVLAGMAFGLAIGTKQTVLAWGPGFAALAGIWVLQAARVWKKLLRPTLASIALSLPFCLPLFWENHRTYGSWLVPDTFLEKFASLKVDEPVRPAFYPATIVWHLSWPDVQSPLLLPLTTRIHEAALQKLREAVGTPHRLTPDHEKLRSWMQSGRFSEDLVPPSIVVITAVLLGLLCALMVALRARPPGRFSQRSGAALAFVLASGVFMLCSVSFRADLYSWRFWVVPAPVLVLACFSLPFLLLHLSPGNRPLGLWAAVLLVFHVPIIFSGIWLHGNNGLQTWINPAQSQNYGHATRMGSLADPLDGRARVIRADPHHAWTTLFFRGPHPHAVVWASKDRPVDAVDLEKGTADTLLMQTRTPPDPTRHRLHLVEDPQGKQIWLVRLLAPGETPVGWYEWTEGHYEDGWLAPRASIALRMWDSPELDVELFNPHAEPLTVRVRGAQGEPTLSLPAAGWSRHRVAVAPDAVLVFECAHGFRPAADPRVLGTRVRVILPEGRPAF